MFITNGAGGALREHFPASRPDSQRPTRGHVREHARTSGPSPGPQLPPPPPARPRCPPRRLRGARLLFRSGFGQRAACGTKTRWAGAGAATRRQGPSSLVSAAASPVAEGLRAEGMGKRSPRQKGRRRTLPSTAPAPMVGAASPRPFSRPSGSATASPRPRTMATAPPRRPGRTCAGCWEL